MSRISTSPGVFSDSEPEDRRVVVCRLLTRCLCCGLVVAVMFGLGTGVIGCGFHPREVCVGGELSLPLGDYLPIDVDEIFPGQTASISLLGSQCHMAYPEEACPIGSMPVKESTFVFPGGDTSCIDESFPFAFQVWPGAAPRHKLLFYFQGGGACWNKDTTSYAIPGSPMPRGMCTQTIYKQASTGVFDVNNPENPFSDYTIVHVNYCGGDAHVGMTTHDYKVDDTAKGGSCHYVTQNGYKNTLSAVEWTKTNMPVRNLTDLVIMGCSAGSLGVGMWADNLLTQFTSLNPPSVIMDSYAGIFPTGVQTKQIKDWGVCNTGLIQSISAAAQAACGPTSGGDDLSLQLLMEETIKKHLNVDFASINSKIDKGQIMFYEAIAATTGHTPYVSRDEYYRRVNFVFERYNLYPNYVSYRVDGPQHCYTCLHPAGTKYGGCAKGDMYNSDTTGVDGGGTGADVKLRDWLALFPLRSGSSSVAQQTPRSECHGDTLPPASWGSHLHTDTSYCDSLQEDKTLSAP